jgi:hypothetical protein
MGTTDGLNFLGNRNITDSYRDLNGGLSNPYPSSCIDCDVKAPSCRDPLFQISEILLRKEQGLRQVYIFCNLVTTQLTLIVITVIPRFSEGQVPKSSAKIENSRIIEKPPPPSKNKTT